MPARAPRSMVREAMFGIMSRSAIKERQQGLRIGGRRFAGEHEGGLLQEVEGGSVRQPPAHRQEEGDPSTCILWCTIALGALVQGCPLEFVSCRRAE